MMLVTPSFTSTHTILSTHRVELAVFVIHLRFYALRSDSQPLRAGALADGCGHGGRHGAGTADAACVRTSNGELHKLAH
jgi:hypothetical protein